MLFGIDFDNTITRDPELFKDFIKLCNNRGHSCVVITMREDNSENKTKISNTIGEDVRIIFCNHTFKRKVAIHQGIHIDIWIDDMPSGVDDQRCMLCYGPDGKPQNIWQWLDRPIKQ